MHFKLLLLSVIFLLSCQKIEPTNTNVANNGNGASAFQLQENCLDNPSFNACLFLKNPLAQTEKEVALSLTSKQLHSLQKLAVNINVNGNELKNSNFEINTNIGEKARPTNGQWKFQAAEDESDKFGQVMAYFWLSQAIATTQQNAGFIWAQNKYIKVFVNDEFSAWVGSNESLHFSKPKSGNYITHNAGLMIYFLGLANLHYANSGNIKGGNSSHRKCGSKDKANNCCTSSSGCSLAIASGTADYFVATIFPDSPTLGETWANNPQGLQACGLSRDLEANKNLNVTAAYNACSPQGDKGLIYNLGTVYASVWWEVRKQANSGEIDFLFQKHLELLNNDDNFESAKEKILLLDQQYFSGKHTNLFSDEFQRRGVN